MVRLPCHSGRMRTMEPDEPKDQDWGAALAQAEVLRRLPPRPSAAEIADAMANLSVSRATLFRRLKRFRAEGASFGSGGREDRETSWRRPPRSRAQVDRRPEHFDLLRDGGEAVADATVETDQI